MFLSRAALLALALVGTACDNGPDIPPSPTPVLVTETFTGTVTLNGAISHGFNVSTAGTTTAEITALDPSGSFLGFQLGTWSGVVCTAVLSNDAGTLASVLNASTQSSASLCVRLHDPNGILSTTTGRHYTVDGRRSPVTVASRRLGSRPSASRYSSITSSSRRLGRRRPTPRLDERMKCRRYCTSAQPSDGSRSICASARLVFECSR